MKGIKKRRHLTRMPLAVIVTGLMFFAAGCVSPEPQGFSAEAPIVLHTAAQGLVGAMREDVVILAERTLGDTALTTTLVRNVAEEIKDAVVSIYVKSNTTYRLKLVPFSPFGGVPLQVPGLGLGSGFFIHPSG